MFAKKLTQAILSVSDFDLRVWFRGDAFPQGRIQYIEENMAEGETVVVEKEDKREFVILLKTEEGIVTIPVTPSDKSFPENPSTKPTKGNQP